MPRRYYKRGEGTVGWIFKRTLLVFASWLGAGILIFAGIMTLGIGCGIGEAPVLLVGLVLLVIGLFLGIFSGALSRWIEVK